MLVAWELNGRSGTGRTIPDGSKEIP
jgi:hypothetical protein